MDFSNAQIVAMALCAVFVGVSKSGFAGGLGMLATPFLARALGNAPLAVGILLPQLLAADIFNFYHFWRKWEWRAASRILPGCLIGVLLGWPLLGFFKGGTDSSSRLARGTPAASASPGDQAVAAPEGSLTSPAQDVPAGRPGTEPARQRKEYLTLAIGIAAIVFSLLALARELWAQSDSPFHPTWPHGLVAGTATGVVSTIAHQGGLITQMYLVPQKLSPAAFVGTATLIYFWLNLSKMPVYVHEGLITGPTSFWSLVNIPFIFLGTWLGAILNRVIPGRLFNRIVLGLVFIAGTDLLVRFLLR